MPQFISDLLTTLVDIAWGPALIVLLMGGGFILMLYSRLLPLAGFVHAIKLTAGKVHFKGEEKSEGQLTHFQALMNALAATVGLGNISGVAVAIAQGGPGAIFWMWVAALIGMNTKFFECTLSVMFRGKDYEGEVQGGPMYVIENMLPKYMKPLAIMFAVFGLLGTLALFQVNQLSAYVYDQYEIPKIYVGIFSVIFTGVVLMGGIQRIAKTTSALVPFMCIFYVICASVIIVMNIDKVPELFGLIFTEAFTGTAVAGGATGLAAREILAIGVKRAAFSNEAGVGTAPMAHGNVKTNEPISEGYVAMLGPFLDTILVCTMTALVILLGVGYGDVGDANGIVLTTRAFESALPGFGAHFLGVAVVLFSLTTMIGMANYNSKCWNYLFKGRWFLTKPVFMLYFLTALLIGSISAQGDVVNLLDIGYGFMAYPNMIATVWLAPKVKKALDEYRAKYKA